MAKRSYTIDLTVEHWRLLAPLLAPSGLGRPLQHDLRIITDAILYVLRTGCQWRILPHDFPPWATVYHHCRKWRDDGAWAAVIHAWRQQRGLAVSRHESPVTAPALPHFIAIVQALRLMYVWI